MVLGQAKAKGRDLDEQARVSVLATRRLDQSVQRAEKEAHAMDAGLPA